jgi:hypothetical protein
MSDKEKSLPLHDVDVQHLYDLLNQNSDWVWEVDAQGRYTWPQMWSPVCLAIRHQR